MDNLLDLGKHVVEWTTCCLCDVIFTFKVKPNFTTICEDKAVKLQQSKKKKNMELSTT